jgi:hypothetical protein
MQFAINFTRLRGIAVSVTTLPIAWKYVESSDVSDLILIVNFPWCYWNIGLVNDAESHREGIMCCRRCNWLVGCFVPSVVCATVMYSEFSETDPLEEWSPNPRPNGDFFNPYPANVENMVSS